MMSALGILYVVATPIGNLDDLTMRAQKVLQEVDYIFSEDTRETLKLLDYYGIKKPQLTYTDQRHTSVFPKIEELLSQGKQIAILSDSGTPLISDPGFKLIHELKKNGSSVITVPGPSAVIAALSVSGLPTDKFTFLGFLPKSTTKQKELLLTYGLNDATLVIYESPYRIQKLLNTVFSVLGDRYVCIARELTKKFEDVTMDRLSKILISDKIKNKGEFVLMVAKEDFNG